MITLTAPKTFSLLGDRDLIPHPFFSLVKSTKNIFGSLENSFDDMFRNSEMLKQAGSLESFVVLTKQIRPIRFFALASMKFPK